MAAQAGQAAFVRAFQQYGCSFKDDGAVQACVELAEEFGLSAKDLALEYEAWSTSRSVAAAAGARCTRQMQLQGTMVPMGAGRQQAGPRCRRAARPEHTNGQLRDSPRCFALRAQG